jgi:hypothetical protein
LRSGITIGELAHSANRIWPLAFGRFGAYKRDIIGLSRQGPFNQTRGIPIRGPIPDPSIPIPNT